MLSISACTVRTLTTSVSRKAHSSWSSAVFRTETRAFSAVDAPVVQKTIDGTTSNAVAALGASQRRTTITLGSALGTDVEMIAANHRHKSFHPAKIPSVRSFSTLKDEYGVMDSSGEIFTVPSFALESGETLENCQLCYQTYGQLNEARDNCLVVCHALTGNASLDGWWGGLLGPGLAFDTDRYFVVCCNILGSCYGSTNPTSINPQTNEMYGVDFPDVSVRDTVRLQLMLLKQELKVEAIQCVIGGSFGGMQAVEFAVQAGSTGVAHATEFEGFLKSVIPIACGARRLPEYPPGILVTVCDQWLLSSSDLKRLIDAWRTKPSSIHVACWKEHNAHVSGPPVIFGSGAAERPKAGTRLAFF